MKGNPINLITDGYMDKTSYNPGDTASVFVNSVAVFNNAKLYLHNVHHKNVDSVIVNLLPQSVSPLNTKPYEDGFGYSVSFTFIIPHNLKSGMYNWENKIFFIVKNAVKNADITIIYDSNTEAAYNLAGGKCLYNSGSTNSIKADAVSILRPLTTREITYNRKYSDGIMKWLHNLNGYNFQFICDQDMDEYSEIQNSKIIVVVGHSEYWSRQGRLNFDKFVDSGNDAIVLSGNTMWWQVRYSKDKTKIICYKNYGTDTCTNPLLITTNWTDPSLHYPDLKSIGVDYMHGGISYDTTFHGWYGYKIMRPNSPLLTGTGLSFDDTLLCKSREYDGTL
ncbi:MAG TPA: N,N-dimethylformamidase beta subunit family domain-containing protein, partial [Nitrosopumilaceae archaeon]|nr:N,N-dimethylformamidase beta subunit family domain-containing protein [Nitrosopumilaceae archaeon]